MDASMDEFTRELFRLSLRLKASDTVESLTASGKDHEQNHKALSPLLFSRRFIISYNIVLLGILCCYTACYWGNRAIQSRQKRISSRSPRDPTWNQKSILESETSPLLENALPGDRSSILSIFRSWMVYQPPNIPFVNKTFPSNATTFGIILFFALNIFYLFYNIQFSLIQTFYFADRAGLLFVANLPLLYILAAKNQPLKILTDASYEGLNIFHRRLGELMCFLALLHTAGMFLVYYVALSSRISLSRFLALPIVWLGLLTFISYESLYFTSLGSFRQKFYELFLALHIFLQVAALAFLWFHHHNSQPYVLAALGIFTVDRLVFRLILKSRTINAQLSVLEDGETVMLSSNWQLSPRPWWKMLGIDIKHGWKPSEHVFLTVPALSHKHLVQAHPFTIASAAPEGPESHAWLNFLIRARDGFSRDLLRYAQLHQSANIRVDGPYGSPHALHMLRNQDVAVVVAGGSGIAVAFPLIWSLLNAPPKDVETGNQMPKKPRVCLIWVVHDAEHLDWIPQDRLDELRDLGCKTLIPPPTRKAGRPNLPRLLEGAVTSWSHEIDNPAVGVVISGPDAMNRGCRNACARLVRGGMNLQVSVEKFGW